MTTSRQHRRTRLDPGDRREQIVTAAQRLFAERPYELVSTGDIATAAGTTRTNVHYYFKTKRDLFLEVAQRFSRIPDALASVDDGGSVAEHVDTVLGRWLDTIERNRETFIMMLHASSSRDVGVNGILRDSMRSWEAQLLRIVALNVDSPSNRAMVRSFQAMVSEATMAWLSRNELSKHQVHTLLSTCLIALGQAAGEPN